MPLYIESGIAFTLPGTSVKHDADNAAWPGVDFIIDEPSSATTIWVEIKNWEPSDIKPRRRGGARRSYLAKMKSDRFYNEILRTKFLGTSAFLYHTGCQSSKPILYIALQESPLSNDAHLLQATRKLRQAIHRVEPANRRLCH